MRIERCILGLSIRTRVTSTEGDAGADEEARTKVEEVIDFPRASGENTEMEADFCLGDFLGTPRASPASARSSFLSATEELLLPEKAEVMRVKAWDAAEAAAMLVETTEGDLEGGRWSEDDASLT